MTEKIRPFHGVCLSCAHNSLDNQACDGCTYKEWDTSKPDLSQRAPHEMPDLKLLMDERRPEAIIPITEQRINTKRANVEFQALAGVLNVMGITAKQLGDALTIAPRMTMDKLNRAYGGKPNNLTKSELIDRLNHKGVRATDGTVLSNSPIITKCRAHDNLTELFPPRLTGTKSKKGNAYTTGEAAIEYATKMIDRNITFKKEGQYVCGERLKGRSWPKRIIISVLISGATAICGHLMVKFLISQGVL